MRHVTLVCTLVALTAFAAVISSQTSSGHALFEQALAQERVEGNLPEAIRLYERVVAEFASDRALAARALVQIGLSYEKLGRDEAVRAYERLVRDFADQTEAADQARTRLAVLRRAGPATADAAPGFRRRELSSVDDDNQVRALSPDGTKAAFLSVDKGQNLAVYDFASQQTTHLTQFDWTATSAWVADPVWSPDGRRLAYSQCSWQNRCEVRAVTLSGESTAISRDEDGMRTVPAGWLPDGSALVALLVRPDRSLSLGLVSIPNGAFTPLRSFSGWGSAYPERPSVSPDGRLIAFVEGAAGMRDIHLIDRDGRTSHRITDHPADDHRPRWSPDGGHLAFLSTRDGSSALWAVAIENGQPAAQPIRIAEATQDVIDLLDWTTRGLVYAREHRLHDIYVVPVDPSSGEPRGRPALVPYRRTGRNARPVWSPDGNYLAFVSSSPAESDRRTVVVLPSRGGDAREFPIPTTVYGGPLAPGDVRWFGDSAGLGFSGFGARGERTLFRLTPATGEWKTSPLPDWLYPGVEWNDDGSRFFFTGLPFKGSDAAIVERDAESDRDRIVFAAGKTMDSLHRGLLFSPDRRLLAFRRGGDQQGIWVVDVETGQARPVLTHTDADEVYTLTWSPDGRALLVARTENAGTGRPLTDLRLMPIDGSEGRRIPLGEELTRLLSTDRQLGSLAWSPDGGSLAFALSTAQRETWLIENPLAGGADSRSAR